MTSMMARELMTRGVLTVSESMPVAELAAFFTENEITGAAVINQDGALVGAVSLFDVAAHANQRSNIVRNELNPDVDVRGWEEIYNREEIAGLNIEQMDLLVSDVMNPAVYAVTEETQLAEIAQKMLQLRLHRIFVTRGDELTGIISTIDFLRLFVDETSAPGLGAEVAPERLTGSADAALA